MISGRVRMNCSAVHSSLLTDKSRQTEPESMICQNALQNVKDYAASTWFVVSLVLYEVKVGGRPAFKRQVRKRAESESNLVDFVTSTSPS